MKYENSSTVSEALSSCYGTLEATWSSKSGNYRLVSETKLQNSISSCKGFLSLAINKELSICHDNGAYWYRVNVASGATSTLLFIVLTILFARLRRSNKLKNKMKRHLPEKFFNVKDKNKSCFTWKRKSPSPGPAYHTTTPIYQPLHSTSPSSPAFSTTTTKESDYHYILENPYKISGQFNNIQGSSQLGPIPLTQPQHVLTTPSYPSRTISSPTIGSSLPGAPASPYPTQTLHGNTAGSSSSVPVPAARQHVEIRQVESIESGQTLQGAEMDRNVFIVIDKTNSIE